MFEASFNGSLDQYRGLLREQRANQEPAMTNDNFDLGVVSEPGQYHLGDSARAKLLDQLAQQKFAGMTQTIREELLTYFNRPDDTFQLKKDKKAWARLQTELAELKNNGLEQQQAGLSIAGR